MNKFKLFSVICSILISSFLFSSDSVKTDTVIKYVTIPTSQRPAIQRIEVKSSYQDNSKDPGYVAMFGDTVIMTIANLDLLFQNRTMENPVVLYANRLAIESVTGHFAGAQQNQIKFILNRFHDDDEDWDKVFRSGFLTKTLYLSAGLKDASIITPISFPIQFSLRTPGESIPFIVLCIGLILFTFYLVWKKNLLQSKVDGVNLFSLSRVHLFFWTFIILLSYMLIWFVCDDINAIDSSSLILLGISAGTAGAAGLIDGTSKNTPKAKITSSGGFLNDILSEAGEVSMHRYQIVLFNLVVGVFFIYKTIDELKMPVINETLLALLGISSATYASLKAIMNKPGKSVPSPETPEGTKP